MKGAYEVVVKNNRLQYKFVVRRNITILKGDSATGKTTLISMVGDFEENGRDSGVDIACDRPCVVLDGRDWESRLPSLRESIVFVDEGSRFVTTHDFARLARESTNYYVIAAREALFALPYSVDEVYQIKNVTRRRQKYPHMNRMYSSFRRLYEIEIDSKDELPEVVVVEDSNAGYRFFAALCRKIGIPCISAEGKSRVYDTVRRLAFHDVLVVADGAAFGSEIEKVSSLSHAKRVRFFLPESFEWLVLNSGLVKSSDLEDILRRPEEYIESRDFFSWERFFTFLLTRLTRDSYLCYAKNRLNEAYIEDGNMRLLSEAAFREGFPEPVR